LFVFVQEESVGDVGPGSGPGSVATHKSEGSEGGSESQEPGRAGDSRELTLLEIMERRQASATVIDILRDEEDFKVGVNMGEVGNIGNYTWQYKSTRVHKYKMSTLFGLVEYCWVI
jgi:hypothetical protein